MAKAKNQDHTQRLGALQKMGVATMDRTLVLYAGFLLGLLTKLPVVLVALSLVSLCVFTRENRQRGKWEVSNHECECELGATMGAA